VRFHLCTCIGPVADDEDGDLFGIAAGIEVIEGAIVSLASRHQAQLVLVGVRQPPEAEDLLALPPCQTAELPKWPLSPEVLNEFLGQHRDSTTRFSNNFKEKSSHVEVPMPNEVPAKVAYPHQCHGMCSHSTPPAVMKMQSDLFKVLEHEFGLAAVHREPLVVFEMFRAKDRCDTMVLSSMGSLCCEVVLSKRRPWYSTYMLYCCVVVVWSVHVRILAGDNLASNVCRTSWSRQQSEHFGGLECCAGGLCTYAFACMRVLPYRLAVGSHVACSCCYICEYWG
jgi:hypothetical protein